MSRRSKIHLTLLLIYVAMVPISYLLGWLSSIQFVSLLSIWALVEGRWGVYQGSRAQDEAREAQE